jgi:hypothetical protein
MIKPHKYLDLNLSVINMGGVILSILQNEGVVKYDELLEKVTFAQGTSAKDVFLPTLSFLYLLGKIEYSKDIDSIEYIK